MSAAGPHTSFVLSSGRTGTVFLTRTLGEHMPEVTCLHEPAGSRGGLMLGNVRNLLGVGTPLVRAWHRAAERTRHGAVPSGHRLVELNPMLCPILDLVAERPGPLRVVHMVRDPRTWVPSIRTFKASGFRRHLIDHVPFANPYPAPRPAGWWRMSQTHKALWRWRYCNAQIAQLAPRCERYAVVRYEDLFSPEPQVRVAAVQAALTVLELPTEGVADWFSTEARHNPSPRPPTVSVAEADVQRICGPWLGRFGYEADASL